MHQRKRGVVAVGTATVSALMPRLVVWVRTGSRDWRRRWQHLMRELGLGAGATPVEVLGEGWITAYEVWGAPHAMQRLVSGECKSVERWQWWTATQRVPLPDAITAPGSGERTNRRLLPGERDGVLRKDIRQEQDRLQHWEQGA